MLLQQVNSGLPPYQQSEKLLSKAQTQEQPVLSTPSHTDPIASTTDSHGHLEHTAAETTNNLHIIHEIDMNAHNQHAHNDVQADLRVQSESFSASEVEEMVDISNTN
jgi:hypothetical protein